jgi:hypothetical protein
MSDSSKGRATRFLGDPVPFAAQPGEDPVAWLRTINRIRRGASLADADALLVVGSHLRGLAETWWSIHEDRVKTWLDFEVLFKVKFCRHLEATYWEEIANTTQAPGQTVEEVALKLKELFGLVNVANDSLMIRTFLKAIDPEVALWVERSGLASTYDEVTSQAVNIDKVNRRYMATIPSSSSTHYYSAVNNTNVKPKPSIEELSMSIKNLTADVQSLKVAPRGGNSGFDGRPRQPLECWNCGETGHPRRLCPKPDQTGKGSGHQ